MRCASSSPTAPPRVRHPALLHPLCPLLLVPDHPFAHQRARRWLTATLPASSSAAQHLAPAALSLLPAALSRLPLHSMSAEQSKASSSASSSPQEAPQPPPPVIHYPPPYAGHYAPPPGSYPPFYAYSVPDPAHHDPNAPNGAPSQPMAPFIMMPPPPGMVYAYPMPPAASGTPHSLLQCSYDLSLIQVYADSAVHRVPPPFPHWNTAPAAPGQTEAQTSKDGGE